VEVGRVTELPNAAYLHNEVASCVAALMYDLSNARDEIDDERACVCTFTIDLLPHEISASAGCCCLL
jgi:hypothetical protein